MIINTQKKCIKLLAFIASILLLFGTLAACSPLENTEEDESFEDFVENEMLFEETLTSTYTEGGPNIKVTANGGYLVGAPAYEENCGLVIAKEDAKSDYLLELNIVDEATKEEYYPGIDADEEGNFSQEWNASASKLIPLSEGYYCEVYAEKASNMDILQNLTIEKVENPDDEDLEEEQEGPEHSRGVEKNWNTPNR